MPVLRSSGACAGQNTDREQGAATHPAIESLTRRWAPKVEQVVHEQARERFARGGRITQRFSLAHGTVLGLEPLSSHLAVGDGRAISAELRHHTGKPEG